MASEDPTPRQESVGGPASPEIAPGRLETIEALDASWEEKTSPNPTKRGLYLRDADPGVVAVEGLISHVTIPDQRFNVGLASGMSAIDVAIGTSLSLAGRKRGGARKDPTLAYAKDIYAQSAKLVQDYENMGVVVYTFDSGDPGDIDRIIDEVPDVIFLETVSNTPNMPVADVYRFLEWNRSGGNNTTLVFDNTLLKKTGFDFEHILEPDDNVLVVESISKAELLNSFVGVGGIVYGSNETLINAVRQHRTTHGPVIASSATEAFLGVLEASLPGFHQRNKSLLANTGKIALALHEAKEQLGNKADFDISYPTLPNHPNHDYAMRYLPNGVSPVVFITSNDMTEGAGRRLLSRITSHPRMKGQVRKDQSFFGQSFGFSEATYFYHPEFSYARFSAGFDMDTDEFIEALKEAAADK